MKLHINSSWTLLYLNRSTQIRTILYWYKNQLTDLQYIFTNCMTYILSQLKLKMSLDNKFNDLLQHWTVILQIWQGIMLHDFNMWLQDLYNFKFDQSLAILFTAVTLNPHDSHGPADLNLYWLVSTKTSYILLNKPAPEKGRFV